MDVPVERRMSHTASRQKIDFGSRGILQFMEQFEIVSGMLSRGHVIELNQLIQVSSLECSPKAEP